MIKRHFYLFILILSLLPIQAQNKVLKPCDLNSHNPSKLLIPNNEFAFLSSPSFIKWGHIGLSFSYSSMTLTLRVTREPTPEEFDTKPNYPWYNQYKLKVDKEIADALFSLFTSAIYSASFIGDDRIVMDGCLYEFQIGSIYAGYTRSPDTKSNCGRLVKITEKVCYYVKNQDMASLSSLLSEVYVLTDIFTSYYPFAVPKWIIYNLHKKHKVKGPSVGLDF